MRSTAPRTRRLTGSCWTLASSCRSVSATSQSESVKVRRSPAGTASAALILVPFGPNQTQRPRMFPAEMSAVRRSVPAPPAAAHRHEYRPGSVCGSHQVFACRLMCFGPPPGGNLPSASPPSRFSRVHRQLQLLPAAFFLPKVAGSIAPLACGNAQNCPSLQAGAGFLAPPSALSDPFDQRASKAELPACR